MPSKNIAITMPTLESICHEVNAIKSGKKLYNTGKIEFMIQDDGTFYAQVLDKYGTKAVVLSFSKDGCNIKNHYCTCGVGSNSDCLCKHIIATVLTIQGGIIESNIVLGKAAVSSTIVTNNNTAKAVGSGSLEVFATPMMIALMEQAACECLADGLEEGQTSVGTKINVSHTAASPIGSEITATAVIEYIFGHKIEFTVSASDGTREIGKGKHTRIIVDEKQFMEKTNK